MVIRCYINLYIFLLFYSFVSFWPWLRLWIVVYSGPESSYYVFSFGFLSKLFHSLPSEHFMKVRLFPSFSSGETTKSVSSWILLRQYIVRGVVHKQLICNLFTLRSFLVLIQTFIKISRRLGWEVGSETFINKCFIT